MLPRSRTTARLLSARATHPHPLCLGAGSNVVDIFFPMRMLPKPGDKTYFANEQCASATVVGGVTLNHLSWARALGVPTGLLAFQGADANGELVRATMAELGVSSEYVRVSPEYATSVSHILSGPDGERTILMAPASTSRLTGDVMRREFGATVAARAAMVTTEVSQLVRAVARAARAAVCDTGSSVTPSTRDPRTRTCPPDTPRSRSPVSSSCLMPRPPRACHRCSTST